MTEPAQPNRWRRYSDWDGRPLRLDQFAREDPASGFGAFKSPADPKPGLTLAAGRVASMDGTLAHAFGGLLQLREVGAVAGHHIENGIDVAEFVVDGGAEQAGGQLALHVHELLAQHIEQVGHVLGRGRILEGDLHRRKRRFRIGLHLLEIRQFLQLLLDGIGDLGLHFRSGGARPDRGDIDHLDGEERVLGAAELLIGEEAGGAERDHQEQDQRRVADRPAREIEVFHLTLHSSTRRTQLNSSLRAKRSNPWGWKMDCFVAALLAMTKPFRTTATTRP